MIDKSAQTGYPRLYVSRAEDKPEASNDSRTTKLEQSLESRLNTKIGKIRSQFNQDSNAKPILEPGHRLDILA